MTLGELHQNSHHSSDEEVSSRSGGGGGGLLPYRSLLGMYRPKGYSFADILNTAMLIVLVLRRFGLERVQSLPILAWNRVWFSREVREFINVLVVSIPADETGKKVNL